MKCQFHIQFQSEKPAFYKGFSLREKGDYPKMSKKSLNLTNLKKHDKQLNEQFEIEVNGYTLKIDSVFRNTKVKQLVAELMDKYHYTQINDDTLSGIFLPYSTLLVIKYFTSLEIPDELERQLEVLEMLIDGGFLNPIVEALPTAEIEKVTEQIQDVVNLIHMRMDKFEEAVEDVEIQNEELLT